VAKLADIFREIDDDLKHEQYRRLWQRHGKWLVAIAVLIVLATAAFVFIREHRQAQRVEASAAYNDALVAALSDPAAADAALTALAEEGGSYGALARLERAGLAATTGDEADAARQYRLLADDGSVDSELRALARILWAYHGLNAGEDTAAIEADMQKVADEGGAWRHSAHEILAAIAMANGDTERAREQFGLIADDADAPQSIRARASEALAALGS
jgi:hypothetical protein